MSPSVAVGASCIYLAKAYNAQVKGDYDFTRSSEDGQPAAVEAKADAKVLLMDAEEMKDPIHRSKLGKHLLTHLKNGKRPYLACPSVTLVTYRKSPGVFSGKLRGLQPGCWLPSFTTLRFDETSSRWLPLASLFPAVASRFFGNSSLKGLMEGLLITRPQLR